MELEKIENLKLLAEEKIKIITETLEEETDCTVDSINFYTKKGEDKFEVDIDLKIRHREEILDKKKWK